MAFGDDGRISIEAVKDAADDAAAFFTEGFPAAIEAALEQGSLLPIAGELGAALGRTLLGRFNEELIQGALITGAFTEVSTLFTEAGKALAKGDIAGGQALLREGIDIFQDVALPNFLKGIQPVLPILDNVFDQLNPTFSGGGIISQDNPLSLSQLFPDGVTVRVEIENQQAIILDGQQIAQSQQRVVRNQRAGFTTPRYV